jgi:hypothetical protein
LSDVPSGGQAWKRWAWSWVSKASTRAVCWEEGEGGRDDGDQKIREAS